MQLVVKDVTQGRKRCWSKELTIKQGLHTEEIRYRMTSPFSMIFAKKPLALWRKKCRRCLTENAHICR